MTRARLKSLLVASLAFNLLAVSAALWLWAKRHGSDDEAYERRLREERRGVLAAHPAGPTDVVMLGDSLTERGAWSEWMANRRVANRGVAGERTEQVAERIGDVAALSPREVFVLAGTNDLAQGRSVDHIVGSYESLLRELRDALPEARIVVTSVPPTRDEPRARPWGAHVNALNSRLRALAEERGLEYLDLHATLTDSSGELCKACTLDGVHLTGEGYRRWMRALDALAPPAPAASVDDATAERCAPERWAVPALDALWSVQSARGEPLVWEVTELERSLTGDATATLAERARDAARADVSSLRPAARIAAQNDLWGLLQRIRKTSAGGAPELEKALESIIMHLAPDAKSLDALSGDELPAHVGRLMPKADGWQEMDTEHAVLGHERAYGLRRLFRLLSRGDDGHALVSQLVALDASGKPHLTRIVGEIEQLGLTEGKVTEAHVWELDRRALRCRGVEQSLHEATRIRHIPGLGASSFLLELDEPEAVASLPCLRCHDDPNPFSLPIEAKGRSISERRAKLLAQASLAPAK